MVVLMSSWSSPQPRQGFDMTKAPLSSNHRAAFCSHVCRAGLPKVGTGVTRVFSACSVHWCQPASLLYPWSRISGTLVVKTEPWSLVNLSKKITFLCNSIASYFKLIVHTAVPRCWGMFEASSYLSEIICGLPSTTVGQSKQRQTAFPWLLPTTPTVFYNRVQHMCVLTCVHAVMCAPGGNIFKKEIAFKVHKSGQFSALSPWPVDDGWYVGGFSHWINDSID